MAKRSHVSEADEALHSQLPDAPRFCSLHEVEGHCSSLCKCSLGHATGTAKFRKPRAHPFEHVGWGDRRIRLLTRWNE